MGSPEHGPHQSNDSFSADSLLTVKWVLVGNFASDGGVNEVGDLIIGLVPGAQGNAGPESLRWVADEQKSKGGQTDFGFFSLVKEDGHQQSADNFLLFNSQSTQGEDCLGTHKVAESLIFPVFRVKAGQDNVFLFLFGFFQVHGLLSFNPLLSHLLLGQVGQITLVALIPFILVVRAGLAGGDERLDERNDNFMSDVTQSGQESHALTSISGDFCLLGQVGDQLAGHN